MRPVFSVTQIREAEEAWFAAHPNEDLMQRAAAAVCDAAVGMLSAAPAASRVLVAVGPGNNGGDGLFAAQLLAARGVRVDLWLTSEHAHEAGLAAALDAGCRQVDALRATELVPDADLVIDAVLGIGGRPGLPSLVAAFAAECADCQTPVLSVDLPSGLDADSVNRHLPPSFKATMTVTFAAEKLCHVAEPAAGRCGRVQVADIGLDLPAPGVRVMERADVARLWPLPDALSDKYARGVVGIDTGSDAYPGAAVLGTTGALFAGAGMIRFDGSSGALALIRQAMPSVVAGPGRVQAWVVGSGWGSEPMNGPRLARRIPDGVPLVIDADAIGVIPHRLPENSLLTPHAGELARFLRLERAEVEADPLTCARLAAARTGITVLLKGATQFVADPADGVLVAVPGPAWTAQAGSGDTLAGVCGTLLAAGLGAPQAAAMAASLQAIAASRLPGPWPPDVIARTLPEVIVDLQKGR